jgi:hypothetical protein
MSRHEDLPCIHLLCDPVYERPTTERTSLQALFFAILFANAPTTVPLCDPVCERPTTVRTSLQALLLLDDPLCERSYHSYTTVRSCLRALLPLNVRVRDRSYHCATVFAYNPTTLSSVDCPTDSFLRYLVIRDTFYGLLLLLAANEILYLIRWLPGNH